jgi:hypothetical protein
MQKSNNLKSIVLSTISLLILTNTAFAQEGQITINPVKAIGSLFKKKEKRNKEDEKAVRAYVEIKPTSTEVQEKFMNAIERKDTVKMYSLLKEGASANYRHQALYRAIELKDKMALLFLINNGVKIEYSQCLFYAIDQKNVEIFNFLIEIGANFYQKDKEVYYTERKYYEHKYWWMLKSYCDEYIEREYGLNESAEPISVGVFEYSIRANAPEIALSIMTDTSYKIKYTERMLIDAASNNMTELAMKLLDMGIKPNIGFVHDGSGGEGHCEKRMEPIILGIVKNKNIALLTKMIEKKADVNIHFHQDCFQSKNCTYPLLEAAKIENNLEVIKLLLKAGAKYTIKTDYGQSLENVAKAEYKYYISLLGKNSENEIDNLVAAKKENDKQDLAKKEKEEKDTQVKYEKEQFEAKQKAEASKQAKLKTEVDAALSRSTKQAASSIEFDGAYFEQAVGKFIYAKQANTTYGRFGRCVGGPSDFNLMRAWFVKDLNTCVAIPASTKKIVISGSLLSSKTGSYRLSELQNFSAERGMCIWDLNTDKEYSFGGSTAAYIPRVSDDLSTYSSMLDIKKVTVSSTQLQILISSNLVKGKYYVICNMDTHYFFTFYAK